MQASSALLRSEAGDIDEFILELSSDSKEEKVASKSASVGSVATRRLSTSATSTTAAPITAARRIDAETAAIMTGNVQLAQELVVEHQAIYAAAGIGDDPEKESGWKLLFMCVLLAAMVAVVVGAILFFAKAF